MESLHTHRGFTLVELMVVLSIITVLTGVVLSSQSSFNKTIVLANTAYDIALTLRSAETYGLSSRGFASTGGALVSSSAGYGLHFETGSPGSFILFADAYPPVGSSSCHTVPSGGPSDAPDAKPGNCAYDGSSEKVSSYMLGNGIIIYDFCAYTNGNPLCAVAHSGGISSLDIVFARPSSNPFISADGVYSPASPATAACITVKSPQGGFRYISVEASGQIIANATSCL
ncbi:type II secretion system protein [bacterium]|nr:MAG: type II secretion system protein [bacterium]